MPGKDRPVQNDDKDQRGEHSYELGYIAAEVEPLLAQTRGDNRWKGRTARLRRRGHCDGAGLFLERPAPRNGPCRSTPAHAFAQVLSEKLLVQPDGKYCREERGAREQSRELRQRRSRMRCAAGSHWLRNPVVANANTGWMSAGS